jgi:tetratricopeptide (TPR) repeat protein
VHLESDEIDDARALIDEIQAIDPGNIKAVIAEGDLARVELAVAVTERDALIEKAERTAEEETRLAELETFVETRYTTAVDRYGRGLDSGGGLDLNVKLGEVYYLAGHLREAEDEFEGVIIASPYRAEAFEGLAKVLLARGEMEEALDNLYTAFARTFDAGEKARIGEFIVEVDPSDTVTRLELAGIYEGLFRWRDAIVQYAAILERRPDDLEATLGIAEAYRWRGEHATALEYLGRAIRRTEERDTPALVRLYEATVDTVEDDVGAERPLGPTGWDALIELARLRASVGANEAALLDLARVAAEDVEYRFEEVEALRLSLTQTESQPLPSFEFLEIQTQSDLGG